MAGTHVTSPNQQASLNSSERKDVKKNMCTSLSLCLTVALPQRQLTSIIRIYTHFTPYFSPLVGRVSPPVGKFLPPLPLFTNARCIPSIHLFLGLPTGLFPWWYGTIRKIQFSSVHFILKFHCIQIFQKN